MYTIDELEAFLRRENAEFALIKQDRPILSASDAEGCYDVRKAAPALILQSERGLVACIFSSGRGRLNLEQVKAVCGFSKLRLADRKKVPKQTGYEVGAVPLIGHGLPCIFDDGLLQYDYIYGGTGDPLTTLKIKPADVKRLNQVIGILPRII